MRALLTGFEPYGGRDRGQLLKGPRIGQLTLNRHFTHNRLVLSESA